MDILNARAAIQSVDAEGTMHVLVEVEWPERMRRAARNSPGGLPAISTALVGEGKSTIRGSTAKSLYESASERDKRERAERKQVRQAKRRANKALRTARRSNTALPIDIIVSALGDLPPDPVILLRSDKPYPAEMFRALCKVLCTRFGDGTQVVMLKSADTLDVASLAELEQLAAEMNQRFGEVRNESWVARARFAISELVALAAFEGQTRELGEEERQRHRLGIESGPVTHLRQRTLVDRTETEISFRIRDGLLPRLKLAEAEPWTSEVITHGADDDDDGLGHIPESRRAAFRPKVRERPPIQTPMQRTFHVEDLFGTPGGPVAMVRPGLDVPEPGDLVWLVDQRQRGGGPGSLRPWKGAKLVKVLAVHRVGGNVEAAKRELHDNYGLRFEVVPETVQP